MCVCPYIDKTERSYEQINDSETSYYICYSFKRQTNGTGSSVRSS